MSQITGVPQTNARGAGHLHQVKQALPAVDELGAFCPAQQTALAQLAIQYCSQMVETPALRTAFFGGSLNLDSAPRRRRSARTARTDLLINPLIAA